MFLIIEMLEKYLKLSSDAEPLTELDDVKESSSSPNEYDSSVVTSPDNLSPPPDRSTPSPSSSCTPTSIVGHRSSDGTIDTDYIQGTSRAAMSSSIQSSSTASATRAFRPSSSNSSSFSSSNLPASVPYQTMGPYRAIGSQHTSLLLENLRSYGRSNRSSLLSSMNFTPAVLEDKQLLRRIRDELKQQQLDIILNRHSRRALGTGDSTTLRLSMSMFMLPTLKSIPARTSSTDSKDGIDIKLSSVPVGGGAEWAGDSNTLLASGSLARVPLISIKYASQEKSLSLNSDGTQTDPIPVNDIYCLYGEYLRQQRNEKLNELKNSNTLSKSMSAGCSKTAGLGDTNAKHSKRKSSIDNEDVSQSVSDTIKRYLRMARKKPANENDANRFKRINYDTNLRNIQSKPEIPKPDELDVGNSKCTQTNDDWCELVIKQIKVQMAAKDDRSLPLSDCQEDYQHQPYIVDRKQTSSSTPTSPTGFFQTSTILNHIVYRI